MCWKARKQGETDRKGRRPYLGWRTLPLKAQTRGRQDKRKNREAVTRNTNFVQGFILILVSYPLKHLIWPGFLLSIPRSGCSRLSWGSFQDLGTCRSICELGWHLNCERRNKDNMPELVNDVIGLFLQQIERVRQIEGNKRQRGSGKDGNVERLQRRRHEK